jgi:hypothetical protein
MQNLAARKEGWDSVLEICAHAIAGFLLKGEATSEQWLGLDPALRCQTAGAAAGMLTDSDPQSVYNLLVGLQKDRG